MKDTTASTKIPGFGASMKTAAIALAANPALLLPPALIAAFNLLLCTVIFSRFSALLASKLSSLTISEDKLRNLLIKGILILLSKHILVLTCAAAIVFLFAWTVNRSGWCAMLTSAARGRRASLGDYFSGLINLSPRFFIAHFIKLCIHAIPALLSFVILAVGVIARKGSGLSMLSRVTSYALVIIPALLLAEALVSILLFMWKPSCTMDDAAPGQAFSAAARYLRFRTGRTFGLIFIWGLFITAVLAIFAALMYYFLQPMLPPLIAENMNAIFLMIAGSAIPAWLLLALGGTYFNLLTFVLFESEIAAAENPSSALSQSEPEGPGEK